MTMVAQSTCIKDTGIATRHWQGQIFACVAGSTNELKGLAVVGTHIHTIGHPSASQTLSWPSRPFNLEELMLVVGVLVACMHGQVTPRYRFRTF